MTGSATGFNITHANRDAALFVCTVTNVFPADNSNASGTTMPDNNGKVDFCFNDTDENVNADILF